MDAQYIKNVIEAALLAAGRPLDVENLLELFEGHERPTADQVRDALRALAAEYTDRGVELAEVANGWRAQVGRRYAAPVSRLWQERPGKYSRALLEILALIAYRQPVTRAEIEDVRGVTVNPNIIRTLTERGWVRVVGHRESPGRPELLGTTREFLDYFGLRSLDELPTLADLKNFEEIGVQLEFKGAAAHESAELAGESPSGGDSPTEEQAEPGDGG